MTYNIQHLLCDRHNYLNPKNDRFCLVTDNKQEFLNLVYLLCNDFSQEKYEIFAKARDRHVTCNTARGHHTFQIHLQRSCKSIYIYTSQSPVQFETEYSKDIYMVCLDENI
jgi:hypothetical protein